MRTILSPLLAIFVFATAVGRAGQRREAPLTLHLALSDTIIVEIQNAGRLDAESPSHAQFSLVPAESAAGENESGFWAPVDLRTRRTTRLNDRSGRIQIRAGQRQQFVFTPTTLRWAKRTSALWPSQSLSKVGSPGAYVLTVRVGDRVSSPVAVHLHYSGQLIQVK